METITNGSTPEAVVYLLCVGEHPSPVGCFASESDARARIPANNFGEYAIVPVAMGDDIDWTRAIVVRGTGGVSWLREAIDDAGTSADDR